MKLCIVTPSVIRGDGQGRANYEIAWQAIHNGHNITIVSSRIEPDLQNHAQVEWVPISTKQYPIDLVKEIIFSIKSAHWLQRHRHKFNIVQTYGAVTSASADVNTVVFVHHAWLKSPAHTFKIRQDFYGFYQYFYTKINSIWERRAFQQAKVIIAVSQQVKKELIDIGISADKVHVIYNGVDLDEFFPGKADRHIWQLPNSVPMALFAGDIRHNRKNLDSILKALLLVPALHLAVVGTTEGSPYPKIAKELDISNRVHFLNFRSDIACIMRAVDFFVFPSRYEPFGMVITEAMASGLPIITSVNTGAAEIVSKDCGFVLEDAEDISTLADALKTLSSSSKLKSKMGKASRVVVEQHDWSSKAQSYIQLFEKVANI